MDGTDWLLSALGRGARFTRFGKTERHFKAAGGHYEKLKDHAKSGVVSLAKEAGLYFVIDYTTDAIELFTEDENNRANNDDLWDLADAGIYLLTLLPYGRVLSAASKGMKGLGSMKLFKSAKPVVKTSGLGRGRFAPRSKIDKFDNKIGETGSGTVEFSKPFVAGAVSFGKKSHLVPVPTVNGRNVGFDMTFTDAKGRHQSFGRADMTKEQFDLLASKGMLFSFLGMIGLSMFSMAMLNVEDTEAAEREPAWYELFKLLDNVEYHRAKYTRKGLDDEAAMKATISDFVFLLDAAKDELGMPDSTGAALKESTEEEKGLLDKFPFFGSNSESQEEKSPHAAANNMSALLRDQKA